MGKQKEAEEEFEREVSIMNELENIENTGKTVAFFYINSNGGVVTRKSDDYVPKMIEIAGGKYIFGGSGKENFYCKYAAGAVLFFCQRCGLYFL